MIPSVFMCSPVHRAMLPESVLSLFGAARWLEANGFHVPRPQLLAGCSMIQMARAELLMQFLHSQSDIMLTFDDDVEFDATTALAMCRAIGSGMAHVIGGQYSIRDGSRFALEYIPEHFESKRFHGFVVDEHKFIEVSAVGAGLLAVSRKAIVSMIDAFPKSRIGAKADARFLLFDFVVRETPGGVPWFRGEDYTFCDRAREIGIKVYCCITARTVHYGRHGFSGDMESQLINGGAEFEWTEQ